MWREMWEGGKARRKQTLGTKCRGPHSGAAIISSTTCTPSPCPPPFCDPRTFLMASAMCGTSLQRLLTCCSHTSRWASLVFGSGCSAGQGGGRGGEG